MRIRLALFLAMIFFRFAQAQPIEVTSPNSVLKLSFELKDGAPLYQISRFDMPVIKPSKLGFILKDASPLSGDFKIFSSQQKSVDETWTQVWGEKKDIRNNYTELRVDLEETSQAKRKMTIVFRVFDDGVGFRYEIPQQPGLNKFDIMDELTEFALTGNHTAWWIGAYQWNRYEYLYQKTRISEFDKVHTPLTMETDNGLYLTIHEAALTDFASMTLARQKNNVLKADLVPWSDGIKVKTTTPLKSPWRTIQIVDTAGELITSYLILNLNEPNKLEDVSWIKPGKYVGIWWEMHLGTATWGSGEKHGATTANTKRYIDFASEFGFDGVLVEGWNIGWNGDWGQNGDQFLFTKPYPDFDINEVTRYAREKGVRLIGHHETGAGVINYEKQMENAFTYYQKLGVRVVKTGYVGHGQNIKRIDENGKIQKEWHHGQYMVRHYRKAVIEAAKHQISLDVHEPIKDTGIRRTYPNMMTREGARGQEYNAWDHQGGNPPEHSVILPFTRLLGGPMDFTPGIFDLHFKQANRPQNRVNTTLAKQLALYVVLYSPLQMAADLPENYRVNLKPFQFIADVPTDWADTQVLHARIGDYITIVRKDRNSENWHLGSITDEEGRLLEAPLLFLDAGKKYVAEIYRDGDNASWNDRPYDIEIEKKVVTRETTLQLRLASGGGQAIRFRPAKEGDF